jgi:hypothetical protein
MNEIVKKIEKLEHEGRLDPSCRMCNEVFYPALKAGKEFTSIFAPRHKAMDSCRSGKYPHCTCDTCF